MATGGNTRMTQENSDEGTTGLHAGLAGSGRLVFLIVLFSFSVNILVLTGPLYMLNVYNRVLATNAVETLLALTVLAGFLFGMMAVLDAARARLLLRIGFGWHAGATAVISDAETPGIAGAEDKAKAVRALVCSPVGTAFFDLPWVPVFHIGLFLFHPLLGVASISSSVLLVMLAAAARLWSARQERRAQTRNTTAQKGREAIANSAPLLAEFGFLRPALAGQHDLDIASLSAEMRRANLHGDLAAVQKALRMAMQSAILGLGAWLVISGQMQTGAMFASAILLARALAPVEQLIAGWPTITRGVAAWRGIARQLDSAPARPAATPLPRARAPIEAEQVTIVPPGTTKAAVRMVSLRVEPGQTLGIIGPCSSGKSALLRGLAGLWRPAAGVVTLDGVRLDHLDTATRAKLIGYLPQRDVFFDGTIAENIAGPNQRDAEPAIAAARAAAAHALILQLPEGYDTRLAAANPGLSGGLLRRISIARALCHQPDILVLDEPDLSLDQPGLAAVSAAIRATTARGGCVILAAQRPSAVQDCDMLMTLERGARGLFGPRQSILQEIARNRIDIEPATLAAGRP